MTENEKLDFITRNVQEGGMNTCSVEHDPIAFNVDGCPLCMSTETMTQQNVLIQKQQEELKAQQQKTDLQSCDNNHPLVHYNFESCPYCVTRNHLTNMTKDRNELYTEEYRLAIQNSALRANKPDRTPCENGHDLIWHDEHGCGFCRYLAEQKPEQKPEQKYKPGDWVKLKDDINGVDKFKEDLPNNLIIKLGEDNDQDDSFNWFEWIIEPEDIECLAPEPPEPKTRKWMIEYAGNFKEDRTGLAGPAPLIVAIDEAKELPAEGPGALVWRDWHGGDCPVPEGKWCIVQYFAESEDLIKYPLSLQWKHRPTKGVMFSGDIIKYAIIDPPQELPDE